MVGIRAKATPEITWYIQVSHKTVTYGRSRLMTLVQFSKGMTTVSLFVPLIATAFAFWFIGNDQDIPWWRIVVSGIFVGLTSKSLAYSRTIQLRPDSPPQSYSCTILRHSACRTCEWGTV